MADVQTPPTFADVILIDQNTKIAKFNPIWLKWFVDLVGVINGGGGTSLNHESLTGLLGGAANDHYHFTQAQHDDLTDGGDTTLHKHLTIDGATIGGTTPGAGTFTNLLVKTIFRPPTDAGALQTAVAIYAGNGVPSNTNGSNGDFYFRGDGAAGTFIYHKAAGAWTAFA